MSIHQKFSTGEIRSFIPAVDFDQSLSFYSTIGFDLSYKDDNLAVLRLRNYSFYLQNHFKKQWADNCMMMLEINEIEKWYDHLISLDLTRFSKKVKIKGIMNEDYGQTIHMLDPSGVLWHIIKFH